MVLKYPERVAFNPALAEHRHAFKQFMRRRAWSDSPILFAHDPEYGNLIEQISEKLVAWYLEKDRSFNKLEKKAA